MNKLQIIAKNSHTFFIDRIRNEAILKNIVVDIINPWEESSAPSQVPTLVRSTAIHGSSQDLECIEKWGLETIPSLHALKTLRTKPLQFTYFHSKNIPYLPWLNLLSASKTEIQAFCHDKKKLLIKPHRGQGGWGVRVFSDEQELLVWWEEATDREYLLQPYLEDYEEIRVFFMRNSNFALKRTKKGVAANFRQAGEAQQIPLPSALQQIVELISEDLALLYGAADFLVKEGRPYLLEMNLVPGIEQLEEVLGLNVAQELLSIFLKP